MTRPLTVDGPTRICGICDCGHDGEVDAIIRSDVLHWRCPRCEDEHAEQITIEDVMDI